MMEKTRKRYIWIDYMKMFACLLVVWGHLYMSMMAGGWIKEDAVYYCWPIQTVYTFHVPLFFVCSGFLYQSSARNQWNIKNHWENIKKKALLLGVPYFTFSIITLILKNVFSAEVNNQATPMFETLFLNPVAPYWYMYVLFLLFCLVPTIGKKNRKKKLIVLMIVATLTKFIYVNLLVGRNLPDLIAKVMGSAIWFVLGMVLTEFSFRRKIFLNCIAIVAGAVGVLASFRIYSFPNSDAKVQFELAIIFVIVLTYLFQSKENYSENLIVNCSTKYFMPIYVLHTIVAAGIRVMLLKIGISSMPFHFTVEFLASIVAPIVVYEIAKKKWYLLFWFDPIRALKKKHENC